MAGTLKAILNRLERENADAAELLPLYQIGEYAKLWANDPTLYRAFARKLVDQGHPTAAYELARGGLAVYPYDQELQYLQALAMARGGNIAGAEECITALLNGPPIESETLHVDAVALRGRLFKDQARRTSDPAKRKEYAARAADLYLQATDLPGPQKWYPLINAATTCLMAGRSEEALAHADRVIDLVREEFKRSDEDADYWRPAAIGEAFLHRRDVANAVQWYRIAVDKAKAQNHWGSIISMRANAALIRDELKIGDEPLRLFHVGNVVVFAGHMIDHPDRGTATGLSPRFPADPALIRAVEDAIEEALDRLNVTVGVCSLACGSEILFAERVRARRATLHVVLPYAKEDFYKTSVDFGLTNPEWQQWRSRFDVIFHDQKTEKHFATSERSLGDEVLWDFTSEFTQGLASLIAGQRGVEPNALVVFDPASKEQQGGTALFLKQWKRKRLPTTTIDLRHLRRETVGRVRIPRSATAGPQARSQARNRALKSMLFADVKGFSTLADPKLLAFFLQFLGGVGNLLRSLPTQPVASNTWGDGLYLVFDRPGDCAEAALRLLELSQQMNWEELGLGKRSPLRVGIHTGPVFSEIDPITRRPTYIGSQVTRAARIEPVTMPGCAFASEQFAALLTVEAGGEYVFEHIGKEHLAKHYDRCDLYRLSRRER